MGRVEDYRSEMRHQPRIEEYLLDHSGLPGPRANLELVAAAAAEAPPDRLRRWAALGPREAPTGSREEFLALCGTVGLGRLAAEGKPDALERLRQAAPDARWRVREGVAMALQHLGRVDFDRLLEVVRAWAAGTPLEQRAAVAAVCEPPLLTEATRAREALDLLDAVTGSFVDLPDRRRDDVRMLRKALGYCWSVAVAALPDDGCARLERWVHTDDADIQWIMRENLRKKRLATIDPAWTERAMAALSLPSGTRRRAPQ